MRNKYHVPKRKYTRQALPSLTPKPIDALYNEAMQSALIIAKRLGLTAEVVLSN